MTSGETSLRFRMHVQTVRLDDLRDFDDERVPNISKPDKRKRGDELRDGSVRTNRMYL